MISEFLTTLRGTRAIDQSEQVGHGRPMSFANRMTRVPRAFDPDLGGEVAGYCDARFDPLLVGTAGSSPYLLGLIKREADWLRAALADPEAAFEDVMEGIETLTVSDMDVGLRGAKRRVALITALADIAGVWDLLEVTTRLTRFADAAVHLAVRRLLRAEIARGKLPGMTEDDAETGSGYFVLAMGKQGAFELNYSSDIDLICLFDETMYEADDYHDVRAALIRVTRRLTSVIGDTTKDGYVFRTDLRLRPDASVTPVCLSTEAAERYYESVGRTWERAALIKARVCGGDITAGNVFLNTLKPFVWRKHLDFAAIQDAHDMRLRIRAHKGLGGAITLPDHNMKLGRGGIREIEFFTQTRQLISGGRDPRLRVSGTRDGLGVLSQTGWITSEISETLWDHYVAHRTVEHRLQMIRDAQTHTLPKTEAGFDRLACLMDTNADDLREDITTRLEDVHHLTEGFFAPDAPTQTEAEDDFGAEVTARWPSYPALRSDRAAELFRRLRPEIMTRLSKSAQPDEALNQFDAFLAGLPAGVQLFSLFDANPQLIDLIVDICGSAPALANYLSRNAGVFDAVIGGAFFAQWPGRAELTEGLAAQLGEIGDYERQLDATRRWSKEWAFRTGVHHLRGLVSADEAGAQYSDVAEACLTALWPVVVEGFEAKHGPQPGRGAVVLGMGSLGSGRLHARSDLDLILIYDAQEVENSGGPRPLQTRTYYARLTQALLTALTAPMAEGRLFEVDMRLRPSGRQGPVATSLASFTSYQQYEAWTWEHLALTRARAVAGNLELGAEIETFRLELLQSKQNGTGIAIDVADMRRRIARAKAPDNEWDAKIGAGRLQDIELFAQSLALRAGDGSRTLEAQLDAGVASDALQAADRNELVHAAAMVWKLQAAAKLISEGPLVLTEAGQGATDFVLSQLGAETVDEMRKTFEQASTQADAIITRHLGQPTEHHDEKG
jgi:[glutamine synthetase] adenylyltransferase / [glutamine synthetase]-adenylyl-L-tyrosine phosphorylase